MSAHQRETRIGERLRRYTPALAGVSRALFDARSRTYPMLSAAAGAPSRAARRALRVRIGSAHGELCVRIDASGYAALDAISQESDPARRAALGNLWLAAPLDILARHGVGEPQVLDVAPDIPNTQACDTAGALHLEYTDDASGTTHAIALLDAPASLATDLERRLARHAAVSALPGALAALSVPTRIRLRSRRCSRALLASLRAGDVLLGWPRAHGYADGAPLEHAMLLWGAPAGRTVCAQARIDGRTTILETFPDTMTYDTDPANATPSGSLDSRDAAVPAAAPVDLTDVELPVHIEVVTVNLSLGQIAALRPGAILTLPLTLADAEIRLVAHGQTLALGELVAVGENLGLQIRHIAHADEQHA